MRGMICGALTIAMAMLVSGPRVARVIVFSSCGEERLDDEIDAVLGPEHDLRGRQVGPSRPVSPWTCSAVTSVRRIGRSQPA